MLNKIPHCLPDIWAGWIDEEQEGLFQNPGTAKFLTTSQVSELFYPGQPNGGRGENCAYIKDEVKGWFDTRCGPIQRWCFCRVTKAIAFKARGINY